jgi:hypothetical protein
MGITKVNLDENTFRGLRQELVGLCRTEFNSVIRDQVDEIVPILCSYKFPTFFEEYMLFQKSALENFAQELGADHLNTLSYQVLKSSVNIWEKMIDNSVKANNTVFSTIIQQIFPSLIQAWEHIQSNYMNMASKQNVLFIKMSNKLDKLFIYILLIGGETHNIGSVEQCLSKLLDKLQLCLETLKVFEDSKGSNEELQEVLEKNCVTLMYDYGKIVKASPFSFSNLIKRVLGLAAQVLQVDWQSVLVRKSALLLIYSFLKQHMYYCEPEYFVSSKLLAKSKCDPGLQVHCRAQFFEYSSLTPKVLRTRTVRSRVHNSADPAADVCAGGGAGAEDDRPGDRGQRGDGDGLDLQPARDVTEANLHIGHRAAGCAGAEGGGPAAGVADRGVGERRHARGQLADERQHHNDDRAAAAGLLQNQQNGRTQHRRVLRLVLRAEYPPLTPGAQYTFFSRRYAMLVGEWIEFLSPEATLKANSLPYLSTSRRWSS